MFSGVLMHVAMMQELRQGLEKMKFAINHKYMFKVSWLAFTAGFLQLTMTISITLLNYYVIIVGSESVIDVVKDFLAM